ncbi:MAG: hypothetical protein R3D63_13960 [Paracoccaceae bacterium]
MPLPRLAPAVVAATLFLAPAASAAQTCAVDMDAVNSRIAELEPSYSMVLSDISCDAPTIPAQQMMCDSVDLGDMVLWRMGRLDDLAWVHAVENATGSQVDQENPPLDRISSPRVTPAPMRPASAPC